MPCVLPLSPHSAMTALDGPGGGGVAPTSPSSCLRGAGSLRSATTLASVLEEADFTFDDDALLPSPSPSRTAADGTARRNLSKSCWDAAGSPAAASRLQPHGRSYDAPRSLAESLGGGLIRARSASDSGETHHHLGHGGHGEPRFFQGLDPSGHMLQPVDPWLLKEMWSIKTQQQHQQQDRHSQGGDPAAQRDGASMPAPDGASVFQALRMQLPSTSHGVWHRGSGNFHPTTSFMAEAGHAPPPSLASSASRGSDPQRCSPRRSAGDLDTAQRDFGRTSHNENQQHDGALASPAVSPGNTEGGLSLASASTSWNHLLAASSLAGYHQPSSKLYKSASAFELYADSPAAEGRVRAGVGRHHEGKVRGGRRYPTEPGTGSWDALAERDFHLMSAPLPVLDVLSNTECKMRGGLGAMEGRVRGGQPLKAQPRSSEKGSASSRGTSFDGTHPVPINRCQSVPVSGMPDPHSAAAASSATVASLTSASLTHLDRTLSSAHLQPVTLQRLESNPSFGKLYKVKPLGSISPNGSLSPHTAGSLTRAGSANGGYLTAASLDGSCSTLFELAELGSSQQANRAPLTSYNSASSAMLMHHLMDPAMLEMLSTFNAANAGLGTSGQQQQQPPQQQQPGTRLRSESDCGRRVRGGAAAAAVGALLEGNQAAAPAAAGQPPMWFLSTEFGSTEAAAGAGCKANLATAVEDDGCERDPITGTKI